MDATDVAVIIGGALAGLIALAVVVGVRRPRSRRKTRARGSADWGTGSAAAGTWGTGKVKDKRTLWARRYGAGGRWTAATWTAGAGGLYLAETNDGVGDPHVRCSGSPAGGPGGGYGPDIGGGLGCSAGGGCGGGGCGGGS